MANTQKQKTAVGGSGAGSLIGFLHGCLLPDLGLDIPKSQYKSYFNERERKATKERLVLRLNKLGYQAEFQLVLKGFCNLYQLPFL